MSKNYTIVSQTEPKDSEKELVIQIPVDFVKSFSDKVIADFAKEIELPGFRKGHAPIKSVASHVGEFKIFEEASQRAIQETVPSILLEEKIDAITMPHIHLTKIGMDEPIEFKTHLYTMPKVELADYKKIAKAVKKEEPELKPEEVDGYINQILNGRKTKDEEGKEVIPALDDEFVKTLGDFKDVDDFKTKLTENMKNDKELQSAQKRRLQIIEEIIKESKVSLPEVLVEEEQNKMLEEFKGRVESMKMDFNEYLTTIKKTEDDLKTEWKDDSTKRAKMNIILPNIAGLEKIKPENESIDKEIAHLKEHHKDIDEMRARVYIAGILTNEKVFQFLENL